MNRKACSLPLAWRLVAWPLVFIQAFTIPAAIVPALAAPLDASAARDPATPGPQLSVYRTPPQDVPARDHIEFSAAPADAEITGCQLFSEPLLPLGAPSTREDNASLAGALRAFANRSTGEDATSLEAYLAAHPDSPWRASIQVNLGIQYARGCFFGRAFRALIAAWDATKAETQAPAKSIADRAVGELAELYGTLGCTEALAPLLEEIKDREVLGSARQKVVNARELLSYIYYFPDHAYNCGPVSLDVLKRGDDRAVDHDKSLFDPDEEVIGRTLAQLSSMAANAGLHLTMAKRDRGTPFPVPCVVHWKTRHFDALVQRQGNRYLLRNPFLRQDVWVTQTALDEETTGYALLSGDSLPSGWQPVGADEGATVWGGCHTVNTNPDNTDSCQKSTGGGCSSCGDTPMAGYTIQLALVNLHISDTPVSYTPPKGPRIAFPLNYNHREANQPQTLMYSNFGRLWSFDWVSYVDATNDPAISLYERGGGTKRFSFPGGTGVGGQSTPNFEDNSVLVHVSSTRFDRTFSDGSKYVYSQATGTGLYFLKQILDPVGNAVTISYDSVATNTFRISGITDAAAQVTTFTYGLAGDSYKVTKITDPFGRSAIFGYNASNQLASITDPAGIVSQFGYVGDFIQTLTTPYGTTSFSLGEDPINPDAVRWIEVTDPLGGKERVEYRRDASSLGVPEHDPAFGWGTNSIGGLNIENQLLDSRNTYYWDKKAMMTAAGDYSKAYIYHWLHDPATNLVSDVLESEKPALESRIWYNYPGQASPYYEAGTNANVTAKGRQIDAAGTMQVTQYTYNDQGNRTQVVDPLGRVTTYVYDTTGIDLLEVRNTSTGINELVTKYTYTDAQHPTSIHRPLTITNAAGQVTTLTYNGQGQMLTRTVVRNGQNETTTWGYDTNGYLKTITGPVTGAITSYTYDAIGHRKTMTDSEGYTVTYDYDPIDRLTSVKYPDGTSENTIYLRLDPVWKRDRLGRWTHLFNDALRRLERVEDPAGRVIKYGWCVCGALDAITDGEGHRTSFEYDVQKRLTKKTYPDSKFTQFTYDSYRNLLAQQLDARGQAANYFYNSDDTVWKITYTDAALQPLVPPTATVTYGYDPKRPRLTSMVDGTGTTSYGYVPINAADSVYGDGMLQTVDGPLANDTVTYTYDELDRVTGSAVNGVGDSRTLDALGRMGTATNALGTFNYTYVNTTNRVSTVTYPNNQTTTYTYWPNVGAAGTGNGDERLQTIWHKRSGGATLSKHDYSYNVAGEIVGWTQQTDSNPAVSYGFGYDPASELLTATQSDATSGAVQKQYTYAYDNAGNRTVEQIDKAISSATYNNLNQLTNRSGAGPVTFEGTVNEPATITVGGNPASIDANGKWKATVTLSASPLEQSIPVVAIDASGNTTTNHAKVILDAGSLTQTLTYDFNGNLTGDGTRTFDWDAKNRLVKITQGGTIREFVYNGADQRVQEKLSGAVVKQWIWEGKTLREERDANNAVTKRFYAQGEQISGVSYYYTRDHLGSVRELTDLSGTLRARYDYDPWGRRTEVPVGAAVNISSIVAGNPVTINTATAHGLTTGSKVTITGVSGGSPSVNGTFTATVVDADTFTIPVSVSTPGTGGTVQLISSADIDFGYTGHYVHSSSALHLAFYRAYDADIGRWLSRDPLSDAEKREGPNVYGYVGNNPTCQIDILGHEAIPAPPMPGAPPSWCARLGPAGFLLWWALSCPGDSYHGPKCVTKEGLECRKCRRSLKTGQR